MFNRRRFLRSSLFSSLGLAAGKRLLATQRLMTERLPARRSSTEILPAAAGLATANTAGFPVVVSTWSIGLEANRAAWPVLTNHGRALDAVEAGVNLTEASLNCCVGLGANPDREGIVTLDACIMDDRGNCGSVGFLERIKHPVSVARRIMEKTPHVMLVGGGAQAFALVEGFPLEEQKLSDNARRAYEEWLKKTGYKPVSGESNHDTIGMIAMDMAGNLSGCCSTSGASFKMRGRIGDSPIIGAGLFVDNEVGAATATGMGEEVIRICGTHTVVELMRQGLSPEQACRGAVERLLRIRGENALKGLQVAFLALNKKGEVGAFALQKGFSYALKSNTEEKLYVAGSLF
jgi:N4-(beta-N-acetylglucosaminyl)-L-asparaginase